VVFIVLLLALLGIPVAEIFFIIRVARDLGIPETIGLLVAVSLVGAWLVRRSGLGVLRQIQDGKYVVVAPSKWASHKVQHPRPVQ